MAQRRKAFAGARQGQRAAHAPQAIARGSEDRPRSTPDLNHEPPTRRRSTKRQHRLRDIQRAVARNRPHQKNDYRAAGTRLRDQTERSEERGAGRGERRPRARPERPTRLDHGLLYAPALYRHGRALFCARGRSPRGLKCARNLLERREGEASSEAGVKATCKEDARTKRTCLLCKSP